jgi:hypothetical protein
MPIQRKRKRLFHYDAASGALRKGPHLAVMLNLRNAKGDCSNLKGVGMKLIGDVSNIRGVLAGQLEGDCSKIRGDVSLIFGDCSSITGDVTNLVGFIGGGAVADAAQRSTVQTAVSNDGLVGAIAGAAANFLANKKTLKGDVSAISGSCTLIYGDATNIRGDVTKLMGDVSKIKGDVSGIFGDVTALSGDVSGVQGFVGNVRGDCTNIHGAFKMELPLLPPFLTGGAGGLFDAMADAVLAVTSDEFEETRLSMVEACGRFRSAAEATVSQAEAAFRAGISTGNSNQIMLSSWSQGENAITIPATIAGELHVAGGRGYVWAEGYSDAASNAASLCTDAAAATVALRSALDASMWPDELDPLNAPPVSLYDLRFVIRTAYDALRAASDAVWADDLGITGAAESYIPIVQSRALFVSDLSNRIEDLMTLVRDISILTLSVDADINVIATAPMDVTSQQVSTLLNRLGVKNAGSFVTGGQNVWALASTVRDDVMEIASIITTATPSEIGSLGMAAAATVVQAQVAAQSMVAATEVLWDMVDSYSTTTPATRHTWADACSSLNVSLVSTMYLTEEAIEDAARETYGALAAMPETLILDETSLIGLINVAVLRAEECRDVIIQWIPDPDEANSIDGYDEPSNSAVKDAMEAALEAWQMAASPTLGFSAVSTAMIIAQGLSETISPLTESATLATRNARREAWTVLTEARPATWTASRAESLLTMWGSTLSAAGACLSGLGLELSKRNPDIVEVRLWILRFKYQLSDKQPSDPPNGTEPLEVGSGDGRPSLESIVEMMNDIVAHPSLGGTAVHAIQALTECEQQLARLMPLISLAEGGQLSLEGIASDVNPVLTPAMLMGGTTPGQKLGEVTDRLARADIWLTRAATACIDGSAGPSAGLSPAVVALSAAAQASLSAAAVLLSAIDDGGPIGPPSVGDPVLVAGIRTSGRSTIVSLVGQLDTAVGIPIVGTPIGYLPSRYPINSLAGYSAMLGYRLSAAGRLMTRIGTPLLEIRGNAMEADIQAFACYNTVTYGGLLFDIPTVVTAFSTFGTALGSFNHDIAVAYAAALLIVGESISGGTGPEVGSIVNAVVSESPRDRKKTIESEILKCRESSKSLFEAMDGVGAAIASGANMTEVMSAVGYVLRGDVSKLIGDVSGLWGDVTGIEGNVSALEGDCTELFGSTEDIPLKRRSGGHNSRVELWTEPGVVVE